MSGCGVYVHIPYCASLCPYCDFNSYVSPKPPWEDFFTSLTHEYHSYAPLFHALNSPLTSVYFGGGTPSLAPPHAIQHLLEHIVQHWPTPSIPQEVTLEANPGTVSLKKFQEYKNAGVQRISLGWQSTHNHLLKTLGRNHSAQDSHEAFLWAREAGFNNISIDLIFAVPGQTTDDLRKDLDTLLALQPEHISLYALTFHEGTPFYKKRSKGTLQQAAHDDEAWMMEHIENTLTKEGYLHYEVSNYAKPSYQAVHNTLYWTGAPYLGIGPGAHSFYRTHTWEQGLRWETLRDPRTYLSTYTQTFTPASPSMHPHTVQWTESLQHPALLAERMMCATRIQQGIALTDPVLTQAPQSFHQALQKAVSLGWMTQNETHISPTPQGMQHADAVAALFF